MQIAVFSDDPDVAASLSSLLRADGHSVTVTADDPLRDPTTSEQHDLLILYMPSAPVNTAGSAATSPQRAVPPSIVLVPSGVAAGVVGYASDDVALLPLPVQPARLRTLLARFALQRARGAAPA